MTNPARFQLPPEVEEQLASPDSAMALMMELATGLFPDGIPNLTAVTWDDEHEHKAPAARDPREDAEMRLREAEARFRTLVEQIPAVTFMAVLGQGKNEIYVSPHVEQMLGYTQEEWLSDPFLWYWRLHPDDRAMWNDEFARGCRTGGPFRADCRFYSRDNRVVWVHGEARLIRDDQGRPMFLQGVAFDITEIKRAQEEAVKRAKLQEELEIARRVQISIVPKRVAVKNLEIAARMLPAEDVGGDYYDVFPFAGGAWIAIGDVAGHGLDAGLIMLMVQAATASLVRTMPKATPRDIVVNLNETLYDNVRQRLTGDSHVTFTLGRFTDDGTFLFAGAHEDILVVRNDGEVQMLRPPGTWLAGRPDVRRVTVDAILKLEPGDLVVLYTDGLTEARSAQRELWDVQRLSDLVAAKRQAPAEEIIEAIFREVAAFAPEQDDDRTAVIFRYTPTGAAQ